MTTQSDSRSPEQRLRAKLPRFLVRPPQGEMSQWDYDRSWAVTLEWSAVDFLKKGWEAVPISCHRPMAQNAHLELEEDRDRARRQRKDQIDRWADGFISDTGTPDLTWPEDREAVLIEVARRLREATADGFLLRALEADRAA